MLSCLYHHRKNVTRSREKWDFEPPYTALLLKLIHPVGKCQRDFAMISWIAGRRHAVGYRNFRGKRKEKKGSSMGFEADVNRTCNLLNRRQTRYHYAMEPCLSWSPCRYNLLECFSTVNKNMSLAWLPWKPYLTYKLWALVSESWVENYQEDMPEFELEDDTLSRK